MPIFSAHPIFYDKGGRRSRYSRRTIFSVGVFLASLLVIMIASIIVRPNLPSLILTKPLLTLRGAPNVPRSTAPLSEYAPFDAKSFITSLNIGQKSTPKQETFQKKSAPVYGFYVNWDDNSFTSFKQNIGKLDVLVPEWLHLADDAGNVVLDDESRQNETLQYIRAVRSDLPIVPLINNFDNATQDWDSARLARMLINPVARGKLIDAIAEYLKQNNFKGISIDFEDVPLHRQADLVQFMSELYGKLHPLGLQVSQNIPLDDPEFDAKKLSQYADFLILMAYDEHSVYDTSAGAVTSQSWFVESLTDRFKQAPPEKYIVALGAYGYDWKGEAAVGTEATFQEAIRTAEESDATVTLDKDSLTPTFDYYDENDTLHHVWFLDAVSAFNQIVAAQKLGGPAGYALWRLGSEDPAVWNVLTQQKRKLDESVAQSLEMLRSGYDIDYEGKGEILRVTAVPADGKRDIFYDNAFGFIVEEKITAFPSAYVITRWGGDNQKKIALTFDDGPDAKYTPQVLSILKKYRVPATFFVVGVNANLHPSLLRRTMDEGHEIGNHTYTHPNITKITEGQFRAELNATERLFEGILGRKVLLFRPPYAEDVEPATPDQIAPLEFTTALNYYTVGMHIDPRDWDSPGVDTIVSSVIGGATLGDGNVVLLHDGGGNRDQTIAALPKIIENLQAQGFELVTIADLLGVSRDEMMPQVSAREQQLARFNGAGFWVVTGFNRFLSLMFSIGIVLGIIRLIFLGTLATAQWAYTRFKRHGEALVDFLPSVAVVIPAYNEGIVVVRTVQAILDSTYPDVTVIVVDDGSTDDTFIRLYEVFEHHPRVKLFTQSNSGKAQALNFGISHTDEQKEIIITLDADTLFRKDTISKLIRRFVDTRIAAVAGNAKVGNRVNILTRWQALEYITSQNFDRRAFEMMNCVTVVPGAVGAWRRNAIVETGGFSSDTLAEDADLTFTLLRSGYRVAYDDEAFAFTEAPDTVHNFIKQRFRWMFGTLQTAWKHRDTLFRPRYGSLGFFAVPNVFVFQVFFPLISPFMDLALIFSLLWVGWQKYQHPVGFDAPHTLQGILFFYVLFLAIDMLTALVPFFLERKEQWSLLWWMPLQRFFYRQLMYYVAIKVVFAAIKGKLARWGTLERHGTVTLSARK